MSKPILSFLCFIVLVMAIYVGSTVFANMAKLDKPEVSNVLINSTSTVLKNTSNSVDNSIQVKPKPKPKPTVITTPQPPTTKVNSGITMADVQKHSNQSSCWTAVNGGVYDLTSFTPSHPGGSRAILSLCGIDGTSAFLDEHGSQRRPNNELAGLKIGDLTK